MTAPASHASAPAAGGPGPLAEREFHLFRTLMHRHAGISLSDAKRQLVAGRLAKRLRQLELDSYASYFRLLERNTAERQTAVDLLTTNETYFFREPKHFDFLREHILPELKGHSPLRVWSAACSSGEEPFTLAMVMAETLGNRPWEIVASDLSTRVLEAAREGRYTLADAEGIPRPLLVRYGLRGVGSQEGSFLFKPDLRKRIQFRQINLNTVLPDLGLFDVIFLRNVMIYFDMDTKVQVVKRVLAQLRPGGYLFLSHSENLNGVSDAVKSVRPSVYRKPEA
ncbi:MAG TPA: protein-glutamate O-methyltransferase CheR [Zoogloea sp.]|uniref:CheR family methyltransferase n=1 Tax=Zoogloea sp. TaxID=49181 RepID=UPI002CD930FA|nr:protein-glutamate O-methyltransferase CheR [Zoogloea sp.]HNI49572.1 protein-glutamate O-methyltransferase CheR [Zoogloea sp.]